MELKTISANNDNETGSNHSGNVVRESYSANLQNAHRPIKPINNSDHVTTKPKSNFSFNIFILWTIFSLIFVGLLVGSVLSFLNLKNKIENYEKELFQNDFEMFHVYKNTPIVFNKSETFSFDGFKSGSENSHLNLTSGCFTVGIPGFYLFHFETFINVAKANDSSCSVKLVCNNNNEAEFHFPTKKDGFENATRPIIEFSWSLTLNMTASDILSLNISDIYGCNAFYLENEFELQFSGTLLQKQHIREKE